MKFEFSDETALKVSALGSAAMAIPFLAAPKESQDLLLGKEVPAGKVSHSNVMAQWMGHTGAINSAATLAVAVSDGCNDAKKNTLKTLGAVWAATALQHVVMAEQGHQKREPSYASAAVAAGLSAMCLWRGFEEEDSA